MNKEIYFNVLGNIDRVTITEKSDSDDIKDLIRSIGHVDEVQFECIVHSPNGGLLMDLDYYFLCENSHSNPYTVSILPQRGCSPDSPNGSTSPNYPGPHECLKRYISHLEKKMEFCEQNIKNSINTLENGFISLSSKVESLSIISWMRTRENYKSSTRFISRTRDHLVRSAAPCFNPEAIIPSRAILTAALSEYKILMYDYDDDFNVSNHLKINSFNNWPYSDAQLMHLVRRMFIDLGLVNEFRLFPKTFDRWIYEVYCGYNVVPFHNFKHAFMVTQMMYSLIWSGNLIAKLSSLDLLILLTASICHDLNHPGFNNAYQINSGSELSVLYNDQSPLENHHSAYCLNILSKSECDIFENLKSEQIKSIRGGIIKCILATDMSRHNEILNSFKSTITTFDWTSQSHCDLLMMILIKSSDISNEARPLDVAAKWIDCLFEEFFFQSDYEKKIGLPVAPFMDREKVTKPASQCGFIRFVIYPLYETLSKLLPEYQEHLVMPVLHQLDYYSHLNIITGAKPMSRKSIVETLSKSKFRRASQQCSKPNYNTITHIDQLKIIKNHNEVDSPRKLSS